jgi:uncharacterized protein
MPIKVNLRHLEPHDFHLEGELPAEELELDIRDELVTAPKPLKYDLEVQKLEDSLLVQGSLSLPLACECVRCLKPFEFNLILKPWTVHLPLEGEDAVPIVSDCVDLTPYIREDILLEFPQHPVCSAECRGLPKSMLGKGKKSSSPSPEAGSPAWAELNKLKFGN